MSLWQSILDMVEPNDQSKEAAWETLDYAEPMLQYFNPSYSTENLRNKANELRGMEFGDWGKEVGRDTLQTMADPKVMNLLMMSPLASVAGPVVGAGAKAVSRFIPGASTVMNGAKQVGSFAASSALPLALLKANEWAQEPTSPEQQLAQLVEPQAQPQELQAGKPNAQFVGPQEGDLTADDIRRAFLSGDTISLKGGRQLANDVRGVSHYDQDRQSKNLGMTQPSNLAGDLGLFQKVKSDLLSQQKPMFDLLNKQAAAAVRPEEKQAVEAKMNALYSQVETEAAKQTLAGLNQDRRRDLITYLSMSGADNKSEEPKTSQTLPPDDIGAQEDSWMWDLAKFAGPAVIAALAAKYGGAKLMGKEAAALAGKKPLKAPPNPIKIKPNNRNFTMGGGKSSGVDPEFAKHAFKKAGLESRFAAREANRVKGLPAGNVPKQISYSPRGEQTQITPEMQKILEAMRSKKPGTDFTMGGGAEEQIWKALRDSFLNSKYAPAIVK